MPRGAGAGLAAGGADRRRAVRADAAGAEHLGPAVAPAPRPGRRRPRAVRAVRCGAEPVRAVAGGAVRRRGGARRVRRADAAAAGAEARALPPLRGPRGGRTAVLVLPVRL